MSDATDAVREAVARNKQLAARCLVRVQDLEADLARLEAAGGDEARKAALETELAGARHDYQAALAELKELDRLGQQALSLEAKSIAADISGDPLIRSPEQVALDNARDHIANLDAQVRLGEELGERPPSPAPAPSPSREQADDDARAEFERLRTKPKKTL